MATPETALGGGEGVRVMVMGAVVVEITVAPYAILLFISVFVVVFVVR